MDIVQNSIEAKSTRIEVKIYETGNKLLFEVLDNGHGMDPEQKAQALDSFYTDGKKHPGRKVGLGLPFLHQAVELAGGQFTLESEPGRGTVVRAIFPRDHCDTPPPGNLASAFAQCISFPGEHEMVIHRIRQPEHLDYQFYRSKLLEALGDFESIGSRVLLTEYLETQEEFHG